MNRAPSLVGRIVWRSLAATVLMLAVLLGLLAWRLERGAAELNEQSLSAQAAAIARHLDSDDGRLRLDLPSRLAEAYADPGSGNHYAVLDRKGRLLLASPGVSGPLDPGLALRKDDDDDDDDDHDAPRYFRAVEPDGGLRYVGGSFPVRVGKRHYWVQVSQGAGHPDVLLEEFILEFLREVGWLLLPFVAGLILVNVLTIRRGLAPLTAVSRQAAAIGPASLHVRLSARRLPRELLPLVGAVNATLERLDQAFRLQREFVADAAHELRTPLAILEAHLDTLADRRIAEELRGDVRRLSRLASQLLRAAELQTLVIGAEERADLRAVCLEVARALAPLALREGRTIEVAGDERPAPVRGNADALGDAVRNLVENAIRHTPAGTAVSILVSADPPTVRVRDRGPGIPEDQRDQIARRFWRADRRKSDGAGLGLAIVDRIARAHGAALRVGSAPEGGAEFAVAFPPAPLTTRHSP